MDRVLEYDKDSGLPKLFHKDFPYVEIFPEWIRKLCLLAQTIPGSGSEFGLLELVASPVQLAQMVDNGYVRLDFRDPNGMAKVTRSDMNNLEVMTKRVNARNLLKQHIHNSLPAEILAAVSDPVLGTLTISIHTIVTHVRTKYGTMDGISLEAYSLLLTTEQYDPATDMRVFNGKFQEAADILAMNRQGLPPAILVSLYQKSMANAGMAEHILAYDIDPVTSVLANRTLAGIMEKMALVQAARSKATTRGAGFAANVVAPDAMSARFERIEASLASIVLGHSAAAVSVPATNVRAYNDVQVAAKKKWCHTHGWGHPGDNCFHPEPKHNPKRQPNLDLPNGGSILPAVVHPPRAPRK